jgi:hypothetical protein
LVESPQMKKLPASNQKARLERASIRPDVAVANGFRATPGAGSISVPP